MRQPRRFDFPDGQIWHVMASRRGGRPFVEIRLTESGRLILRLEGDPFDSLTQERIVTWGSMCDGLTANSVTERLLAIADELFPPPIVESQPSNTLFTPNPPMRSGLGVRTRGEGRGTRRSALDSDKWGRWRPLVVVGGADGGPGQRRWGGVGGTVCRGRQSRTGPVRLCGAVG